MLLETNQQKGLDVDHLGSESNVVNGGFYPGSTTPKQWLSQGSAASKLASISIVAVMSFHVQNLASQNALETIHEINVAEAGYERVSHCKRLIC